MTAPSISMPANSNGANCFFFSSSVANCSLADRISCLSFVRLSSPTLSTTLKKLPLAACFKDRDWETVRRY